jgi:hypothetical protein
MSNPFAAPRTVAIWTRTPAKAYVAEAPSGSLPALDLGTLDLPAYKVAIKKILTSFFTDEDHDACHEALEQVGPP